MAKRNILVERQEIDDVTSSMSNAVRSSYERRGNTIDDSTAYTLGYIQSTMVGIIHRLPASTRKQVMQEFQNIISSRTECV